MVARSGVVFPASMADILANLVEIFFGSFTATSTTLVAATSPTVSMKVLAPPAAAPRSNLKSKTHPPKPYDIIQGMERISNMMEEILQIYERAQRSTQDALCLKTVPFGLRPSSDSHAHQVANSIQIQSEQWGSIGDLKIEPRARRDPLDVPCTYHKGARHTLCGYRLQKKIDLEHNALRRERTPTSPDVGEFQKARIRVSANDQSSTRPRILVVSENEPPWIGATDSEEARQIQGNANHAQRQA
jgi:hypothetical protein